MSEAEAQPVPGAARCPRCGADLAPEQEWCLACGTAARTAVAPTPNWKLPILALAVTLALCGAAVAWALVEMTENDAEVQAATKPSITKTVPLPAADPAATAPPATPTAPATSTPPAATTTVTTPGTDPAPDAAEPPLPPDEP
ncbi:MAG TPA: hypothetical protein VIL49_05675 [Capillimicrobium sp.]